MENFTCEKEWRTLEMISTWAITKNIISSYNFLGKKLTTWSKNNNPTCGIEIYVEV